MSSVLLLGAVACLLAIPGIPASALALRGGAGSVITAAAAVFGLGYAAAAGCAFALAAAHVFNLAAFLVFWLVVSAGLWAWALWRGEPRSQVKALASDIAGNRLVLLVGALVIVTLLALHLRYLTVLNGPRYVYYLNGLEIANSHGVPRSTLEYGQSWPPATDKVYLDAFTGVLALLNPSTFVGPAVFLLISALGAAVGLWATAWELGLRRTGIVLPVLYLGNTLILNTSVSIAYTDYRAEDFGRAVAFCALAVGIAAIRERGWRPAIAAGVILAAASGTHLIPVVVVALALALAGVGEFFFGAERDSRLQPLLRGLALAGTAGFLGLVIRVFAGGAFGLEGASSPSAYSGARLPFDPTAYLYGGMIVPPGQPRGTHWYSHPWQVVEYMITGTTQVPAWQLWLWLATPLLAAAVLLVTGPLRRLAVVGLGIIAGTVGAGVLFAVSYDSYIEQTFGIRRLTTYVALGFLLVVIGVVEALLGLLEGRAPRVCAVVSVVTVLGLGAWLLPSTAVTRQIDLYGRERAHLVDWVRTSTSCDARFLVNQRTEGTFTALTGRLALLEGMGAFLRTKQLPYVVELMLSAKRFFRAPLKHEEFLRKHDISFVVVALGFQELGYQAPLGPPNLRELNAAPFLHRVFASRSLLVYQVDGAQPAPASPLLRGPYLHCMRTPLHT
ncbi:MAG TPA: hypothetical protein VF834_00700 [Streptosporangiaceae bacterium]